MLAGTVYILNLLSLLTVVRNQTMLTMSGCERLGGKGKERVTVTK